MGMKKKNPSVAVVALMLPLGALMLALVVLAAACDASQLAVCVSAIMGGAPPTPECCANLTAQQGCFCQCAMEPANGSYIKSPNARKTLQSCHLAVPTC
jgi:hypothetical protein